ncbi:MAG: hypothetical protein R3C68_00635 [Myxococcota bacterium]
MRTDADTGQPVVERTTVHAAGMSAEVKLYKDERNIDIKGYSTWHKFINDGGGDGLGLGILARLNTGQEWLNAFRVRTEYRSFADGFLPLFQYTLRSREVWLSLSEARLQYQVTPTKYQEIFGDPENGFERQEDGRRNGYNVEASWGVFKRKRSNKKNRRGFGTE